EETVEVGLARLVRELPHELEAAAIRVRADQFQQAEQQRRQRREMDAAVGFAAQQHQGRFRRWLRRLESRADAVDRPAIGQRPGERRQQRDAGEQVAFGIGGRQGRVAELEAEFGPFVMREFGQPRALRVGPCLEEGDQLAAEFGEQRRAAVVVGEEAAQQRAPAGIAQGLADDREAAGQQTIEIVEDEVAVDLQAARLDAGRAGMRVRIAHVRGERAHLFAEALFMRRVHAAAACNVRMRSTSSSSAASGGKLRPRSSRPGRGRCSWKACGGRPDTPSSTAAAWVWTVWWRDPWYGRPWWLRAMRWPANASMKARASYPWSLALTKPLLAS